MPERCVVMRYLFEYKSDHFREKDQGLVDATTNAEIDIVLLDHRKKLNEIISMHIFTPAVQLISSSSRFNLASLCAKSG